MRSGTYSKGKMKKNIGMSLVEVLVAIIILSVSLMAFFSSFIATALYDKQSRDKQRATKVAEGFMEAFKAYSMEELYIQYTDPSAANFKIYTGSFSNRNATPVDLYNWTTHEFKRLKTGNYVFKVDVDYDTKQYNIITTVSPATKPLKADRKETDLFNKYEDAFCILKQDLEEYVYADAVQKLDDAGTIEVNTTSTLERSKIKIGSKTNRINITGTPGAATVNVVTEFTYKFENYEFMVAGGAIHTLNSSHTVSITSVQEPDYAFYNNTGTGSSVLRNVYVYFYPEYKSGISYQENFTVNCAYNDRCDVYLIKQVNGSLSSTELTAQESNYSPSVTKIGSTGDATFLHTNILKRLDGGLTPVDPTNITGFANTSGFVQNDTNLLDVEEEVKDISQVYNVVVEVYDKDSGDLVYTLNGSKNSD